MNFSKILMASSIFFASHLAMATTYSYDFTSVTPLVNPGSAVSTNVTGATNSASAGGYTGSGGFYYGSVTRTGNAYFYTNLFDVSIPVTSDMKLTYWVKPMAGSKNIAIDLSLNDGTTMRSYPIVDQNGALIHPSNQGYHPLNVYSQVTANIGILSGKTITRILVGYSEANAAARPIYGFVDDIVISNQSVGTSSTSMVYAKYFSIDPVTSAGGPVSGNLDSYLTTGYLKDITNGFLENTDFKVTPGFSLLRAQANTSGQFYFSSLNDANHRLGQVSTYRALSKLKSQATLSGRNGWFLGGKNIRVETYHTEGKAIDNAYFTACSFFSENCADIVIGKTSNGNRELAFDGTVTVHEMGHANFTYANDGKNWFNINDIKCNAGNSLDKNYCCSTNRGCIGAIDEGQADFHSFLTHKRGIVGPYFENSTVGFPERNAELNSSLTAATAFNNSVRNTGYRTGEIHDLGGVYNAVWWSMKDDLLDSVVEKLFFAHLKKLTSQDDFITAKEKIVLLDKQLYPTTNHEAKIRAAFAKHGL